MGGADENIAGIPLEDEALREEVFSLAAALGKVLHEADAEAVLWALSLVSADAIGQASDDLATTRHLFAGYCWNLHQSIEGLAGSVINTGNALDLTDKGKGMPLQDQAAVRAATPYFGNLFTGLLATLPANVVISGMLSALVSVVCSLGDEESVKRFATMFRQIAKALPETRDQIEASRQEAEAFRGRATVGDVGRA